MEDSNRIFKFHGRPGEDFYLWSARTEAALESKEVLQVVVTDVIGDGRAILADEEKVAIAKARAIIIQGLGDKRLRLCLSEKGNPYKMWARLRERYAVSNIVTRIQLQTKLCRFTYVGQVTSDYIDEFEDVFNRLAGMDSSISEQMQVAMVLASFGDKSKSTYGLVVSSIQMMEREVSWESVTAGLLQEYEEKVWAHNSSSKSSIQTVDDSAMALTAKFRGRPFPFKPRGNHRGTSNRPEKRRCYERDEIGHLARDCGQRRGGQRQRFERHQNSVANHATMLMAMTSGTAKWPLARTTAREHDRGSHSVSRCASCVNPSSSHDSRPELTNVLLASGRARESDELLLDSGASDHMVKHRDWLSELRKTLPKEIMLGDGSIVISEYTGTLKLRCGSEAEHKARELNLREVLLVPQLKNNLLSCSTLCRDGYTVELLAAECTLSRPGFGKVTGMLRDGIYHLDVTANAPRRSLAMTTQIPDEALWHDRLGHAHRESIIRLHQKGAIDGMSLQRTGKPSDKCTACIGGKHHRKPKKSKSTRATMVGASIHSDVCGPMQKRSIRGSLYLVTFIDEFSGFLTVVPISKKSDVASSFKKYLVWFERRYDCRIEKLHSDGGGEYIAFSEFLKSCGIEFETTPPYSPEQNGIAERANRTLVESARSMLIHARMPRAFRAEAVAHAADIRNRLIAPRKDAETAFELVTNRKPRVDHLRVFGSVAYTLIPKEKRKKVEDKSRQGVIIGCYDNGLYKVWLQEMGFPVISRNVHVLKNTFPPKGWYSVEEENVDIIVQSGDQPSFQGHIQDRDMAPSAAM